MKNIMNDNKPFNIGMETYENKFVNPVIMRELAMETQLIEEISIVKSRMALKNAENHPIGKLTAIWGVQYGEVFVMAYDVDYANNDMADTGINDTAYATALEIREARNDSEAEEIGVMEYKPIMKKYWDEREAQAVAK